MRSELLHQQYPHARIWNGTPSGAPFQPGQDPRLLLVNPSAYVPEPQPDPGRVVGKRHGVGRES